MESAVLLHLKYNPADPQSHDIQKIFQKTMLNNNDNCKCLPDIEDQTGLPMGTNKLIVAYSKQKNIKNLVFPRQFDKTAGPLVSKYLKEKQFGTLYPSKKSKK